MGLEVTRETPVAVRVRVHPALCEGWGNCHRFAPEVYPLDDDGHVDVHLLEVPPEHAHAARLGASACPEHAITIIRTADPDADVGAAIGNSLAERP